jgi:hypothetical protein
LTSLVLSTVAYFVAAFYIRRYLEGLGVEKTMTRGFVVFVGALAVAYTIAWLVDLALPEQAFKLF